ncbi:MAG: sulfurtransferase-like selenium metabolism protein YedF [Desulfosudaceae bacterium]
MTEIDARGLACPSPVLRTKAALEDEKTKTVTVVVDNEAARQNVQRFLESQGFTVSLEQQGGDYHLTGYREAVASDRPLTVADAPADHRKILILCATDRLGSGDDELGRKLMISFLRTIKEMGEELWRLILVNNGVKLAAADSEVLADLRAYEQKGLTILVCGTCLTHFNLLEQKEVGVTTNMLDIVTAMQLADKVITI